MNYKFKKILHVYAYTLLFTIGIFFSVFINGEESNKVLPFIEMAEASLVVSESTCDGYTMARKDDYYYTVLCNCDTVDAFGIGRCESDDGDDGDDGCTGSNVCEN